MNKKDTKRLDELLNEISEIFESDEPKGHIEKIKDINRELKEIFRRNIEEGKKGNTKNMEVE